MLSIEFTSMDLKRQFEISYKLLTTSKELKSFEGFLESYYAILPYFKSQFNAFMFVNVLHFKKYNSFKFLSYEDFYRSKFGKQKQVLKTAKKEK